ncbi:MAG TPA: hypothetical protein VJU16_03715 [Planctomycetota bacterium]|nr:hypothetical protein [Planctomycetota bacterium]
MIRHKVFRFARATTWETACTTVENWINANLAPEDLVSVMMEDNEERWGDDVLAVWYRDRAFRSRDLSEMKGG